MNVTKRPGMAPAVYELISGASFSEIRVADRKLGA